ncbi:hypothetical protein [Palleronia rufa]|uniref:hypothetical protein n=1 Tax=Palleronia rufa TaxID=1530186 RepID=UPI0005685521|nr:hypothetical protein [Palleronia rufa]
MLPKFQTTTVSLFRARVSHHLDWVRQESGHLYLTSHGQRMAAVVPVRQADLIAQVCDYTVAEQRRRNDRLLTAWEELRRGLDLPD